MGFLLSIFGVALAFAADPLLEPDMDLIPVEDRGALVGPWRSDELSVENPPESVKRVELDCDVKTLAPTQPTQTLKKYHKRKTIMLDHFKLTADSKLCRINNKKSNLGKPKCLKAETLEFFIGSDTYEDACGNMYRGYFSRQFAKGDETQGTAWSPGHMMYEKEMEGDVYDFGSTVKDMVDGNTHLVDLADDLIFLGELLPGDREKIEAERERAENTHSFNKKKRVWFEQ